MKRLKILSFLPIQNATDKLMKQILLLMLFIMALGASASDGFATGPKTSVMVSDQDVYLDQLVSIEAKLTWPQSEGVYKFMEPEIATENLEFDHDSRSEETYMAGGRPWQRATLTYYFKPQAAGAAALKHIKIAYLNTQTQESGTITLIRTVDFKVHPSQRAGFWLISMVLIVVVILVGGGVLAMWSSKRSGDKIQRDQVRTEKNELDAVLGKIQNASGTTQKEVVFDWAKQFKIFVIHQYGLPKTLMTETDTLEAIKGANLPQTERMKVEQLFEGLSAAKFTSKDLNDEEFHRLQNALISFIKSKQIVGAP